MHRRTLINACTALGIVSVTPSAFAQPAELDPENTLFLDLKQGRVVIELFPDIAPKHVARIKTLARQGFYDGTPFHRVMEGFMAQGGDPTGTGAGGSKLPNLPPEFSKRHFIRGVCGMARSASLDSANSQFFIMFDANPSLDGQYTIWGQVRRGMEYGYQIKRGTGPNGKVLGEPDRTVHMRVAADVK
jgi:peptidylprolyl isomerase